MAGDNFLEDLTSLRYEDQCNCVKDRKSQEWALFSHAINVLEVTGPSQQ